MILVCTVILLTTVFLVFRANNLKAYVHFTPLQLRQLAARIPVELNPRAKFNCLVTLTDPDCKLLVGQYISKVLGYHYRPTHEIINKLDESLKAFRRSEALTIISSGQFPNNFTLTLKDRQKAISTILAEPAISSQPDLLRELNEALPCDDFISRALFMPHVAEYSGFWRMYFTNANVDFALKNIIAITGAVDRIMQWCVADDNEITQFMHTPHKASLYVACRGDAAAAAQFATLYGYASTAEIDEKIRQYVTLLLPIPQWIGRCPYNEYVKNILLNASEGFFSSGSSSQGLDRFRKLKIAIAKAEAAVLVLQQISPEDRAPLIAQARAVNSRLNIGESEFDIGKPYTEPIRNWEPLFSVFWVCIETEQSKTFFKSFLSSTSTRQMKNVVRTYLTDSARALNAEL